MISEFARTPNPVVLSWGSAHHDNVLKIYQDKTRALDHKGQEDLNIELDDIDRQHLYSTATPRLRSRFIQGDPAFVGQPHYTHQLKEDVQALYTFLQTEARRSVIREFLVRHKYQVMQSHALVLAVQDRYISTGVNIDTLTKTSNEDLSMHVSGLCVDPHATKRERTETAEVVRGLLQTPDLLHKPMQKATQNNYHDRIRKIRGTGYRHSRETALQSRDNIDVNLQAARLGEGDIYSKGGQSGTWDGTVYKQTLLHSLRRKLIYKLYFDALRHQAASIRGARLLVLSIEARRLTKTYKLCFQAIVTEALYSLLTQSQSQLTVQLLERSKYMMPALRRVFQWKVQSSTSKANQQMAAQSQRRWQYRRLLYAFSCFSQQSLSNGAALNSANYSARMRRTRQAVQWLMYMSRWRLRLYHFEHRVQSHLLEWECIAPWRGFKIICAQLQQQKRNIKTALSNWRLRQLHHTMYVLRRNAKLRHRRIRARVRSLLQDKQKLQPLTMWAIFAVQLRRIHRCEERAKKLLRYTRGCTGLQALVVQLKKANNNRRALRRAQNYLFSRSASQSINALYSAVEVVQAAKLATARGRAFFRINACSRGWDCWRDRILVSRRVIQACDLGQRARSLHCLVAGWVAIKEHWAVHKRARALRRWAQERALRVQLARAHSAWVFAYVKKCTLRSALERRLAREVQLRSQGQNVLISNTMNDAKNLEECLTELRTEALSRIGAASNVDVPLLEKYLRNVRRSAGTSNKMERALLLQATLERQEIQDASANGMTAPHIVREDRPKFRSNNIAITPTFSQMRGSYKEVKYISNVMFKQRVKPIHSKSIQHVKAAETNLSSTSVPFLATLASANYSESKQKISLPNINDDSDSSESGSEIEVDKGMHQDKGLSGGDARHTWGINVNVGNDAGSVSTLGSSFTALMSAANSLSTSNLHHHFRTAHSIQRARAPPLRSNYLDEKPRTTRTSLLKALASDSRSSRSSTQPIIGRTTTDEDHSVLNPSQAIFFRRQYSGSTLGTGLMERAMDISGQNGFKMHSHIFGEVAAISKADDDNSSDNDSDVDEQSDRRSAKVRASLAEPLDAALLLVRAGRWALLKLKRNAHRQIADRRVRALDRKRRLRRAQTGWVNTYFKALQVLAMCHRMWTVKASKDALRQLYYRGVTRMRILRLKLITRIRHLRASSAWRIWREQQFLHRSERVVRRASNLRQLERCLASWKWSKRHVPSIVKFKAKQTRRLLYPCLALWRTKARKLRKLRRCFEGFFSAWNQRYVLTHQRADKSRLYEVYEGWKLFVKIMQEERHQEKQQHKALVFRSAALCARCFMGWLDYHLMCLKVKRNLVIRSRAKVVRLQMLQRIFIKTTFSDVLFRRAQWVQGATYRNRRMCKLCIVEWATQARQYFVEKPLRARTLRTLRNCFDVLRLSRRERLMNELVLPMQQQRRMKNCLHAWNRIYTRKMHILHGGNRLEKALMRMRMRAALELWPGRESFEKAEEMRLFLEKRGRAKIVLVDIKQVEDERLRRARAAYAEQQKERSFIQMRQNAPIERRAALFGMISSADDPEAVSDLFDVLRAVIYAWFDAAHTDASLRGMERLTKFRHQRALLLQSLRTWIGRCSATSHRLSMWIKKQYGKQVNRKLVASKTEVATVHLVAQYAKLDLD